MIIILEIFKQIKFYCQRIIITKKFYAHSGNLNELITVQNKKIVEVFTWSSYGFRRSGYRAKRNEKLFDIFAQNCMQMIFLHDAKEFEKMLKEIENDSKYYEMGKAIVRDNSKK